MALSARVIRLLSKYDPALRAAGLATILSEQDTKVDDLTDGTISTTTVTLDTLTFSGGGSPVKFIDDDTLGTATATAIASAESIKAYVDNENNTQTSLGTLTALTGGTGDFNWDSGTLFVDASLNKVGIGTTSPGDHPDEKDDLVIGDLSGHRGMTIASGATSIGTIRFAPSTTANNGEGWIDYSNNSKAMRFGTNGLNTRMTIDSSGNVTANVALKTLSLDIMNAGLSAVRGNLSMDGNSLILSMEESASTASLVTIECVNEGSGTAGVLVNAENTISLEIDETARVSLNATGLAFFGATPVAKPSSTGEATGYTATGGTNVQHQDTFTGNSGSTAYTLNDIVKHLKALGLLTA